MSPIVLQILLAGCATNNDPPVPVSLNGVAFEKSYGHWHLPEWIAFTPGETIELRLEVRDPEGDPVEAWWPWAPEGFDFPPTGGAGTWEVPADFDEDAYLDLILRDQAPDPASTVVEGVYFLNSRGWG